MPYRFLSNSASNPTTKTSDLINDNAVSLSSTSTSSSASPDMWNYLWIPFLISLSKAVTPARAATATTSSPSILLPTQLAEDSPSVPRCPAPDIKLNYRPVIGILSHPGDGASGRLNNATNASYIAASYVKFAESAGARVIPLIYNEPREILFEKLNLVNGVLFTGGWAKTGLYFDTVKAIFKLLLSQTLLLWDCSCPRRLFRLLSVATSPDLMLRRDQASTLQFMENTSIEGTVFQRIVPQKSTKVYWLMSIPYVEDTDSVVRRVLSGIIFRPLGNFGISPQRFQENEYLSSFFEVLTTSADEDNQVYVSTVQARSYPVTAFQWHPEKNAFEWGLSMIPHSEDAIQVTQHVANFFVSEARKSLNRPPARKVLDNLIYNYSPTYCGKAGKGYDEVYIFAEPTRYAVHDNCHGRVKL
ncbi:unnamed protein product [Dovyalis caffra]|uniref:folate gamma-glutamyl hydrolase n=1 Tax=Dovyalis caffra TaxID=77055 RepID=A0AAV1SLN0_9ROSI|nr:unnamed protein product [Dovyalis caffra]